MSRQRGHQLGFTVCMFAVGVLALALPGREWIDLLICALLLCAAYCVLVVLDTWQDDINRRNERKP